MFDQQVHVSRENATKWCLIALLVASIAAAYANHFHNGFHFDDAHTIENNAAIRSLAKVGQFFRDASTFSALPSNQSYRPLVSTLLAFDYWLGGGLNPFIFHLSIFALFVSLILLLVFFVCYLLASETISGGTNWWIALVAGATYALHPANADTVNYIIAVSDVISTVGVVASFVVYLAFPRVRPFYVYVVPAAAAVLAKPPAAVFPLLLGTFLILFPNHEGGANKNRIISWLKQVLPTLVICAGALFFVQHMTPRTWVAGATNTRNYLITQPYVALLYFVTFFCPNHLSADYDLAAFTTTDDGRFWLGFGFLIIFPAVSILLSAHRRTRVIGFGFLWFLVALLPTSLFPLAEAMNDHRTFFPYIGLTIAMAGAASLLVEYNRRGPIAVRIAAVAIILVILPAAGYTTWKRNEVWRTEESLWRDVTIKSPHNARGLMNYGVTLMAKGDFTGARDYFYRAKALTPLYPVLLINLAIAEDAATHSPVAEDYFRQALQLASSTPDSYTYYARWLLAHGRAAEAGLLIKKALELSPADLAAQQLWKENRSQLEQAPPTPESYLSLSLLYYNDRRYAESIKACQSALALRPDYAEAWNNIGAAQNQLGDYSKAAAACEQALRLNPQFELARNNLQFARTKMSQTGLPQP
jgi:tetratricopeptide (TPR) repeat protein